MRNTSLLFFIALFLFSCDQKKYHQSTYNCEDLNPENLSEVTCSGNASPSSLRGELEDRLFYAELADSPSTKIEMWMMFTKLGRYEIALRRHDKNKNQVFSKNQIIEVIEEDQRSGEYSIASSGEIILEPFDVSSCPLSAAKKDTLKMAKGLKDQQVVLSLLSENFFKRFSLPSFFSLVAMSKDSSFFTLISPQANFSEKSEREFQGGHQFISFGCFNESLIFSENK